MRYLIIFFAFFSNYVLATDYVQQPGSSLGFSASYQGEAFVGSFAKFNSSISFDPTKLAQCKFDVRITLNSANTKNSERDEMLVGPEFFNASAPLTFTWTPGAKPQLVGTAKVQRLDFKVGIGDWDDLELIPNAVTVNTRLILLPAAKTVAPLKAELKKL